MCVCVKVRVSECVSPSCCSGTRGVKISERLKLGPGIHVMFLVLEEGGGILGSARMRALSTLFLLSETSNRTDISY